MRSRIALLVESVKDDRNRSNELFQYVWTQMCIRRGLMRIVREITGEHGTTLVVEEVRSGQIRLVPRPDELDIDIESLAVQALAKILEQQRRTG